MRTHIIRHALPILLAILVPCAGVLPQLAMPQDVQAATEQVWHSFEYSGASYYVVRVKDSIGNIKSIYARDDSGNRVGNATLEQRLVVAAENRDDIDEATTTPFVIPTSYGPSCLYAVDPGLVARPDNKGIEYETTSPSHFTYTWLVNHVYEEGTFDIGLDDYDKRVDVWQKVVWSTVLSEITTEQKAKLDEETEWLLRQVAEYESTAPDIAVLANKILKGETIEKEISGSMGNLFSQASNVLTLLGSGSKVLTEWSSTLGAVGIGLGGYSWASNLKAELAQSILFNTLATAEAQARLDALAKLDKDSPFWDPALEVALPRVQEAMTAYSGSVTKALWEGLKDAIFDWDTADFLVSVTGYIVAHTAAAGVIGAALGLSALTVGTVLIPVALITYQTIRGIYDHVTELHDQVRGLVLTATLNYHLGVYLGLVMPSSLLTKLEGVEYAVRINNMGHYLANYYYVQYWDYNKRLFVFSDPDELNSQLEEAIDSSLRSYWRTAAPYWLATDEWTDLKKDLTTPTVIIDTPSDGASASGIVTISAHASDNDGKISQMVLKINGTSITSGVIVDVNTLGTSATLSHEWDTSTLDPGSAHRILVQAKDNSSKTLSDDSISLIIQPEEGDPPPIAHAGMSVSATGPILLDGHSVSEITAVVTEEDGDPIGGVEVWFWSYPSEYAGFAEPDGTLLPIVNLYIATTSYATGEATAYYRPTRWGRTYIMAETKTGLSAETHFDSVYEPAAPADFHLDISPTTRDVGRSESTTYEVTVVPENGYYRPVTLTADNLPDDVSASGTVVLPGEPTTIQVSVGNSAPYGTHAFQFVGTGDDFSRSEDAVLVVNQGTIELVSPNGGEVWYFGQTYLLEWNYSGGGSVDIEVSSDGGRTWIGGFWAWPNDGSEPWDPDWDIHRPSDRVLVRVSASSDESIVDTNDDYFMASDHTLYMKLTSPIGGEVLPPGSFHDIEWTTVSDADVTGVDILYSSDGGATWTIIVADYPDLGVYRWHLPTEMSDQCRVKLVATDASPKTGEVESGDFTIGLDPGAWKHTYFGYVPEFIQVDPTNSNIAYLGDDGGGVFKTIDAGETITPLTGPEDVYDMDIDPNNTNIVYVCDNGAGLYRTMNGGDTWQVIASGWVYDTPEGDFNLNYAEAMVIHPDDSSILFLVADDGVFKSTNGGDSWTWLAQESTANGDFVINPDNPDILYTAYTSVKKSTDGGHSWTAVSPPMGGQVYALAMDPQNSSVLYAGGREGAGGPGVLLKTTDGGSSWTPLTYEGGWPSIYAVIVDPLNSAVYVGAGAPIGILKSTDGGSTWSSIGPSAIATDEGLGMGTTPSKLLYAGSSGAGTSGLWVKDLAPPPAAVVISPNGGEEWMAGSNHDILWTTTDPGGAGPVDLYYSATGDTPWEAIATGLPDTGNYSWKLPVIPGTSYKVKVVVHNVEGETVEATSEETFTVIPETMPPAISEMGVGQELIETLGIHSLTLSQASAQTLGGLAGEIGTLLTISSEAVDSLSGVDPTSVEAHLQYPDNTDVAVISLYDDGIGIDEIAGDGIFTGQWDSSGATEAFHFVDISASDLSGNERIVDNAVLVEVFDYPVITDISYDPSSPTDQAGVTVSATITDTSGISIASIEYSSDGGTTWPSVSMNNISGDEWSGTIPQLAAGTVQFRIMATDTLGHGTTTTADSYGVLDVTPPTVYIVTPTGNSTPVSSAIEIGFTEAVNTSSVEGAISISPAMTYSSFWMGDRLLIIPDDELVEETEYTVIVLGTAQDSASNSLDGDSDGIAEGSPDDDYTWSFTTSSQNVEVELSFKVGWNMVSVPVTPTDNSTSAVFPSVAGIFTWNATSRSYYVPTVIDPKEGYWVAVTENTTMTISGTPIETWTTDIKAGWNMIGSVNTSASIADPSDDPDGSVIPTAYWWDPVSKSYILTTDIEPGKGYWVASVNDCTLTL